MATRKRGLGRGLDALLTGTVSAPQPIEGEKLRDIPLDELHPGRYQPRREIDPEALESLAQSIRAQGVVQPLVVRESDEGYEIIAGERRWRASRIAGLRRVPAIVREVPDEVALAVALIENIQREDLNPLEEAVALQRLIQECKMTHKQCAESVGRSRASVSNLLRMLELDEDVQAMVRGRKLEMGHARALLSLPSDKQSKTAQRVVALGLSVRQTEAMVRQMLQPAQASKDKPATDPRVHGLEKELSQRLGKSVRIQETGGGKGRMVLKFGSLGELDELLSRLG